MKELLTRISRPVARLMEKIINDLLFRIAFICRMFHSSPMPRKIFISKIDSIGDFILFSPCLALLREIYREKHIVLLVQDKAYALAEKCPYVDEVWQINHRMFRRNPVEKFRWFLKMFRADFQVAVESVYSTNLYHLECLIGWSGAPRRIGFTCTYSKIKRDVKSQYFNELVPERKETVFEMERDFEMLRYLGSRSECPGKAELWLQEEDLLVAEEVKKRIGTSSYAVVFPGAGHCIKVWKAENFIETIAGIFPEWPMCWIVCGSVNEFDVCEGIQKRLESLSIPAENYAGKTTLREVCGLMQGAAFYLGNDTMATHLAAAVGVPSVCILGGAHYGRFYPYPGNCQTVSVTADLECQGCNWECSRDEAECIISIPVEKVVHAARNLLQSTYAKQEIHDKKRCI
jgi:ADP-heptose:LPS heptosyltransferase